MSIWTSWIGRLGPFSHNSEETYPDGAAMRSARFEGPVRVDGAPSADTDTTRKLELDALKAALIRPVEVADIDDPSEELAAYAGSRSLPYLFAYEVVEDGDDLITLYGWRENSLGTSTPFIVAGTGGVWVAIGGQFITSKRITASVADSEHLSPLNGSTSSDDENAAGVAGVSTGAAPGVRGSASTTPGGEFTSVSGPALRCGRGSSNSTAERFMDDVTTEDATPVVAFSYAADDIGPGGIYIDATILICQQTYVSGSGAIGDVSLYSVKAAFKQVEGTLTQVGATSKTLVFGGAVGDITIAVADEAVTLTLTGDANEFDWGLTVDCFII